MPTCSVCFGNWQAKWCLGKRLSLLPAVTPCLMQQPWVLQVRTDIRAACESHWAPITSSCTSGLDAPLTWILGPPPPSPPLHATAETSMIQKHCLLALFRCSIKIMECLKQGQAVMLTLPSLVPISMRSIHLRATALGIHLTMHSMDA